MCIDGLGSRFDQPKGGEGVDRYAHIHAYTITHAAQSLCHDPTALPEPPKQMPLRTVGAVFVVNALLLLLPLGTPLAFTSITSVCTIGAQVLL